MYPYWPNGAHLQVSNAHQFPSRPSWTTSLCGRHQVLPVLARYSAGWWSQKNPAMRRSRMAVLAGLSCWCQVSRTHAVVQRIVRLAVSWDHLDHRRCGENRWADGFAQCLEWLCGDLVDPGGWSPCLLPRGHPPLCQCRQGNWLAGFSIEHTKDQEVGQVGVVGYI